jgi:hypothetical protein
LLATLEKGLGKDLTPSVREAWVICYTSIAREMTEGTGHRKAPPVAAAKLSCNTT